MDVDSLKRFVVVDLGTQINGQRRFAVWDMIRDHQTWARVADLVADFKVLAPKWALFTAFLAQRDVIAEQAFRLGFERDGAETSVINAPQSHDWKPTATWFACRHCGKEAAAPHAGAADEGPCPGSSVMVDNRTEDVPLTPAEAEALRERLQQLNLTSCDFVGDSGCSDPDCWRCHSTMGPENLRMLAENIAVAALLSWAWQLREADPLWTPCCGKLPAQLSSYMEAALASPHIGAFLRRPR